MSVLLNIASEYIFESANYVTNIHPGLHPDRILEWHDFLYIIEGTWEIAEEEQVYQLQTDDLIILAAGRHHYGTELSSPNNRHMYIHACEKSLSGKDDSKSDNVTKEDYLKQFDTVIHCQNNPFIRQLFEEVIQVSWREENLKEYLARLGL